MSGPALRWIDGADEDLRAELHWVITAVVEQTGAIGWLRPPSRPQVDAWLDPLLADVAAGDGALCVADVDGRVGAIGSWQRWTGEVFAHSAEIRKIMADPAVRGQGLGRAVTVALVADATAAGMETLHLGVRGNNHLAMAMYADLGFVECGRIPDVIEVGNLRFDDVRMVLKRPRPPGVEWRGGRPGGPGSS